MYLSVFLMIVKFLKEFVSCFNIDITNQIPIYVWLAHVTHLCVFQIGLASETLRWWRECRGKYTRGFRCWSRSTTGMILVSVVCKLLYFNALCFLSYFEIFVEVKISKTNFLWCSMLKFFFTYLLIMQGSQINEMYFVKCLHSNNGRILNRVNALLFFPKS